MRRIKWSNLSGQQKTESLMRPAQRTTDEVNQKVDAIIRHVQKDGDKALRAFSLKFDGVAIENFRVEDEAVRSAWKQVSGAEERAIREAIKRVEIFHAAQRPRDVSLETGPGVTCSKKWLPIDTVGLYVPGGTAPLVSTVIMLAVPARIAGCRRTVLCTPARRNPVTNKPFVSPHILVAASLCNVTDIFTVGGAQAIAALAYGTESIPRVNKIFGPGNQWVTQAKQAVSQMTGGPASDMPAGPSEVMVVIDETSDPGFAAADLLAQAEHGADSQVILVSLDPAAAGKVLHEADRQLSALSRRELIASSLEHALVIDVDSADEALDVINRYAPEHLILMNNDAAETAKAVRNAGSIFVGPWSPESVGDYASGTNHVLPTSGYAAAYSGLGVESFMKAITCQQLTVAGIRDLGPTVEILADIEGLSAHKNAVSVRLERLRSDGQEEGSVP